MKSRKTKTSSTSHKQSIDLPKEKLNYPNLIFVLALAFTANFIWLYEITAIKSWNGLLWLNGPLYSTYIILALPPIAFLSAFLIKKIVSLRDLIIPFLLLYAVSLTGYFLGKELTSQLYCRYCIRSNTEIIILFVSALFIHLFIGIAYRSITNKFIQLNKIKNIFLLTALLLLVLPFSLFSIRIYTGFGTGSDLIDAIKMGYPVFWTTLVLGIAGMLLAIQPEKSKKSRNNKNPKSLKPSKIT